ncbi:TonB-dependent receptor [Tenacibaculum jejuense]|uniref:Probable TonB-dependent outer membrane receptor n=1 Tax=Tenacibaculum jejuense TaxID=584609 RepID=A0A238UCW2_9FLAO|nr:TonB-dependent receptor [Tenacibaculum jejuense]SNR17009.1 Probable TonB-dependent outer membrane receptor precursor [Tenacibaculum jejuense]
MKTKLFIFSLLMSFVTFAQVEISGKVIDTKGNPIPGANVYLDGTYDGASTDENGKYSFTTSEEGTQTIVVSFISFETFYKTAVLSKLNNLVIKLREDINTLDAVVINAGSFDAGEKARAVALKPLDIVTTASALGDVVGAFQTLPGTSANDEDGRLFVRGGDANETQMFIDGIRVFNPFVPTSSNVPTRGRFSPFLFKGMTFSTGGYSAEYGQALSSVLTLNTIDQPDQEKTEIQLMTVGAGIGNTQIWGKNSFSINTSYINLAPYQIAFPGREEWNKPFEGASGEMVYRYQPNEDGLLKLYSAFNYSNLDVIQEDINFANGFNFALQNTNLYFNGSYKQRLGSRWSISGGMSYTNENTDFTLQDNLIDDQENSAHFKVKVSKRFSSRIKLNFGSEYFITNFKEKFTLNNTNSFNYGFNNNIFGTFAETDIFFSKKLAAKVGLRAENNEFSDQMTFSPRASLAYKSGAKSQFSFAYGKFYQNPRSEYLKFSTDLNPENATHYIANYQFMKDKQQFRIEAYYKQYDDLVKFDDQFASPSSNFDNNGDGFAKGVDVFWRDNKNIKNLDYWVSYSYLDTERDHRNFPTRATPNFASSHNASVVGKYWVDSWKTQLGVSYRFATGRTYTNPNKIGFLNEKTKNYNSVSLNAAYLISQQKILYISVNNVLGTENVFGYNYSNQPNMNGTFERQALRPTADQFFFIGFFWSISDDNKSNQLDNI